jgi:hypothetical protein
VLVGRCAGRASDLRWQGALRGDELLVRSYRDAAQADFGLELTQLPASSTPPSWGWSGYCASGPSSPASPACSWGGGIGRVEPVGEATPGGPDRAARDPASAFRFVGAVAEGDEETENRSQKNGCERTRFAMCVERAERGEPEVVETLE